MWKFINRMNIDNIDFYLKKTLQFCSTFKKLWFSIFYKLQKFKHYYLRMVQFSEKIGRRGVHKFRQSSNSLVFGMTDQQNTLVRLEGCTPPPACLPHLEPASLQQEQSLRQFWEERAWCMIGISRESRRLQTNFFATCQLRPEQGCEVRGARTSIGGNNLTWKIL